MLLAVEGGGFFSSSASGYSKGLTLLLLGQQKNEEKPMRVSPWDQYQLVDQETASDLQLASTKNRLSRGCASFICFGRASAGPDTPSPLKVGPAQHQENSLDILVSSDNGKDHHTDVEDEIHNNNSNVTKVALKSNLKKPQKATPPESTENRNEHKVGGDDACKDVAEYAERRKVQWTDVCGNDLVEIREFEPSESSASDDELENGNERSCSCSIM